MRSFWEKVEKTNSCWIWCGYIEKYGYGRVSYKGNRHWLAHRLAWTLSKGTIPDGLHVLHKCDNPGCVNPDHLFLGTHADNMADRDKKGRGVVPGLFGDKHPNSKLRESDIRVIRQLVDVGCEYKCIAWLFDISRAYVSDIKNGRRWSHVQ